MSKKIFLIFLTLNFTVVLESSIVERAALFGTGVQAHRAWVAAKGSKIGVALREVWNNRTGTDEDLQEKSDKVYGNTRAEYDSQLAREAVGSAEFNKNSEKKVFFAQQRRVEKDSSWFKKETLSYNDPEFVKRLLDSERELLRLRFRLNLHGNEKFYQGIFVGGVGGYITALWTTSFLYKLFNRESHKET